MVHALSDDEIKEMETVDRETIRRNDEVLSWLNRWIPTLCKKFFFLKKDSTITTTTTSSTTPFTTITTATTNDYRAFVQFSVRDLQAKYNKYNKEL